LLGIARDERLLDETLNYIFKKAKTTNNVKIFDYDYDFKYYYYDFLKLGIDLTKDNIDWWKFDRILSGMLEDETTYINKVLSYRTYKKSSSNSKIIESERNKYYLEKKREYSLPQKNNNIDISLLKLQNYLERRVKNE
jgi:hypothetical protein